MINWYLKYGDFAATQYFYFTISLFSYIIDGLSCYKAYPFCYFHNNRLYYNLLQLQLNCLHQ